MERSEYRRYDPRLKNLVAASDDIRKFLKFGISLSTLREWKKNGVREFFSIPELELSTSELISENMALKAKLAAVIAEHGLVLTTIKIFGFQVQYKRLPSSGAKEKLLTAIKAASESIPLSECLAAIGLTAARYHNWLKREVKCLLEDRPSCPRVSPTQMIRSEIRKIQDLYTSKDFSHYSIQALSWLGKKTGEVMASPSTWSRVIRELGLKKNRIRIYPPKPRIGIRASAPGQIWHLDQTILRLGDGTKAFVQCIIDNYSRYVLAWKVSKDYGGARTKELIEQALAKARSLGLHLKPNVLVDSGCENINEKVDVLVDSGSISMTIAQIDIEQSNSMVEMLFHRMKHRYLFTILLSNFESLVKGADFYLYESNTCIPHSALKGATPEEIITGSWTEEKKMELKEKIIAARLSRVETNKAIRCTPCLA
jgi:putative transposase